MSVEPMPKNYGLLKGIVITLAILIVAMVITLVVASVMKYNDQKREEAALVEKYQTNRTVNPSDVKMFETSLALEPGQNIISVDSNDKGIVVSVGANGVAVKILFINYNGKIVGTINAN